jgi:hypothetical protein
VRQRQRGVTAVGIVAVLVFLVLGGLVAPVAAQLDTQPGDPTEPASTEIVVEPVPTEAVPTDVPTVIAAPTEAIEPTVIPEPTATLMPTEVPTMEPEPTPEPTPTPTIAPTPTPTPEPPVPFDPALTCKPGAGDTSPITGATEWSWLDCGVTWATKDVSSVKIRHLDPTTGWEIVPVNDRVLDDPAVIARDGLDLTLTDDDSTDTGFLTSRFAIASRLACEATPSATIFLEFEATSGNEAAVETVSKELTIKAIPATVPDVHVASASFSTVDISSGAQVSTGTITVNYANASAFCGWTITTTVDDFVSSEGVIPASGLSLINVSGADGATSSRNVGTIVLLALPGTGIPSSGTITLTVSVPVPEEISAGDYTTTISSTAGAP